MAPASITIIGAGHGAAELATSLRQNGYQGGIRIIGEEPHLPYQRPPLSKAYLSGKADLESLYVKGADTYERAAIETVLATRVLSIDRVKRSLTLSDGSTQSYQTLILATGGRPRRLSADGSEAAEKCANFHYLRTATDVQRIHAQFKRGARLVIIGGGYIGLEVAAVARQHGLQVTVIEAQERVLARVTAPELSSFYERVHREAGVVIVTGTALKWLQVDGGQVTRLELTDGRTLDADLVIAGIGLLPNPELAPAAGLAIDNGIAVDAHCRTDDPDIYAMGDCASQPNAYAGRRLRLESVPSALYQARAIAHTLTGKALPAQAAPWFWSDQYDLKLQMVGLSQGHDQLVVRGSTHNRAFTAFYLREGRVIAADAVSRPAEFMIAKQLVALGARPAPAHLGDESVALKSLLP